MSGRSGQCLCGAVRFTASELGGFGVCHCVQCRRWAGSALFGVTVPEAAMTVQGAEHIRTIRSSGWAARSFCRQCGSGLWYRHDRGVDGAGDYEVPVGLLDDGNGLVLTREIFADEKPDSWALAGAHERLTRSQTLEKYGDAFGDA
jgi:hypothetical protein